MVKEYLNVEPVVKLSPHFLLNHFPESDKQNKTILPTKYISFTVNLYDIFSWSDLTHHTPKPLISQ